MAEAKLPPHSLEAEQQVLGGLISDSSGWVHVADLLTADDFYREDHRLIFQGIATLADAGKAHDVVTVPNWLRDNGYSDRAPATYVGELAISAVSAANIRAYAEVVRENSLLRQMIAVGDSITVSGFDTDGRSAEEKLDEAEQELMAISGQRSATGYASALSVAKRTADRLEKRMDAGSDVTGIPTGFIDLDRMMTGLQDGELTIVAGRSSMGKSACAMQIAYNVAAAGQKVVCHSLEMPAEDLMDRQISARSHVPFERIRQGKLVDGDWDAYLAAMASVKDSPIHVSDMPGITARGIRTMARREHMRDPVHLVVVDHIGLMQMRDPKNRNDSIGEITAALKQLALELKCPVIAVSQLNRECDKRNDKRPVLSDLRDSGNVEQDADNVIMVYRDEYYNEDNTPHAGIVELLVRKQRNGPVGAVDMTWDGEHVCLRDYSGPTRAVRLKQWKTEKKGGGTLYDD